MRCTDIKSFKTKGYLKYNSHLANFELMLMEVMLLRKGTVAPEADVVLSFHRVDESVRSEVRFVGECLVAAWVLASVRTFACVGPHVTFEKPRAGEMLVTNVALILPLEMRGLYVTVESQSRREQLAASAGNDGAEFRCCRIRTRGTFSAGNRRRCISVRSNLASACRCWRRSRWWRVWTGWKGWKENWPDAWKQERGGYTSDRWRDWSPAGNLRFWFGIGKNPGFEEPEDSDSYPACWQFWAFLSGWLKTADWQ